MILASLDRIDKSYGKQPLLHGISLVIKSGERLGLVGRNGVGKTTLLEIIARLRQPDSGSISFSKETKATYLRQEPTLREDNTLYQEMEVPFRERISLQERIEAVEIEFCTVGNDPTLQREYNELLELREKWGEQTYDSKIKSVTRGLGFPEGDLSKKIRYLSGGQKNRAALAQILLTDANLLLLDEPTNHLDISGREFLENFLLAFKGGALIVSHDRYLLDRVTTHIAELQSGSLKLYHGDYSQYLPQREAQLKRREKLYLHQREFIKRQEDFIRRNIAGQKTRQAQSRRRMLQKLDRIERPKESEAALTLRAAEVKRLPRKVVELRNVDKSFEGTVLFQGVNLLLERGDKIGLIGPNGCGKTTLLKLLLKLESPDTGEVLIGKNVVSAHYPQEVRFDDPSRELLDYLWEQVPDWTEGEVRTYLGRFLFSGEEVKRSLKSFSGGEQSRALLARLLLSNANFLLLDEPTNHLDIPSTEVLENFLADFKGTVLAVSHDRYFLDRFTNKILSFENGCVTEYLGNYSDYLSRQVKERTEVEDVWSAPGRPPTERRQKPKHKREVKVDRPKRKKGTFKAQQIEKEIEASECQLQGIEEALESQTHSTDWAKLTALAKEKSALEGKIEELYRRWAGLVE
ncbi:MAG: ABC-F family ATP-binding cassette domain-containing protein [Candidatus Zixiibacteriota bacterium]